MNSYLKIGATTILWLVVLSLSFFTNIFSALAQDNSAGVGIIPAVIDPAEKFKPGQTSNFNVKVSNLSNVDQTYFLSKRDIIGVTSGAVPIFSDENSEQTGYELSDWIELSVPEVFVKTGESVDISFRISVPMEVSPGSHFGSIVLSVEPPKLRTSGASIGYEVANIISIMIEGEVNESARIRQFATSKYIYGSTNVEFNARIENEGNTLVKPTGPLEIVNMFGKRVAMLTFNESQGGVFPKTSLSSGLRDYTLTWEDETPGFGRYEALLSAAYGSDGKIKTISSTATFWILPMNIVLPALGAFLMLLLIVLVTVKLYVRRSLSIAASGSTRRLVRSRRSSGFPTLLVLVAMLALAGLFFIVLLLIFA